MPVGDKRNCKRCLCRIGLMLSLLMPAMLMAETLRLDIRVLDQQQQPVADAIVINPETPLTTTPTTIAVMDQQNRQFTPRVLGISRGQKVAFPNSDNIRHPDQSDPARIQQIEALTWQTSDPHTLSTTVIIERQPNIQPVKSSRFRNGS